MRQVRGKHYYLDCSVGLYIMLRPQSHLGVCHFVVCVARCVARGKLEVTISVFRQTRNTRIFLPSLQPSNRSVCHIEQAVREAWHEYEAEEVVSVMAEWKRSFWQEEYDIYTDTRTWKHKWVKNRFGLGLMLPEVTVYVFQRQSSGTHRQSCSRDSTSKVITLECVGSKCRQSVPWNIRFTTRFTVAKCKSASGKHLRRGSIGSCYFEEERIARYISHLYFHN